MVVNNRKRYRKVLATVLALALLAMMILTASIQGQGQDSCADFPVYSDDYAHCIFWLNSGVAADVGHENEGAENPTPTPTATPSAQD